MATIEDISIDSSLLAILIKLYVMLWYSLSYYTQINFTFFSNTNRTLIVDGLLVNKLMGFGCFYFNNDFVIIVTVHFVCRGTL